MLPLRLLAAVHLVMILRAPVAQQPATREAATPAPQVQTPQGPAEKVLAGSDEAMIWVVSPNPRVKIETHRGVSFNIDFATHSAMCLAQLSAELSTEPRGITLSFNPTNGILSTGYDKDTKQFQIFMNGGKEPISRFPLKLYPAATRVLLRQREQLALFAIPPDGGHVTLVWLGGVSYIVTFRNAAQYELCKDVKITMGKKEITQDQFRRGIKLNALDEIGDVVVTGSSPSGELFKHRYTLDYKAVTRLVDGAYGSFMKVAGNGTTGEEAGTKTAPLEISQ
jgi:hypothetical protein